jgi:hypothetical protein
LLLALAVQVGQGLAFALDGGHACLMLGVAGVDLLGQPLLDRADEHVQVIEHIRLDEPGRDGRRVAEPRALAPVRAHVHAACGLVSGVERSAALVAEGDAAQEVGRVGRLAPALPPLDGARVEPT